ESCISEQDARLEHDDGEREHPVRGDGGISSRDDRRQEEDAAGHAKGDDLGNDLAGRSLDDEPAHLSEGPSIMPPDACVTDSQVDPISWRSVTPAGLVIATG